jgi:hypothetical protein
MQMLVRRDTRSDFQVTVGQNPSMGNNILCFRTVSGKLLNLCFPEKATIKDFKKRLEKLYRMPAASIRLILCARTLDHDIVVRSLGISQHMSCIQSTFATFPFTNLADDTSVRPNILYEARN